MIRPWQAHYDQGVPLTITYPNESLVQLFERAVSRFPDQTCLFYEDSFWTYREVSILVDHYSRILIHLGLGKGERVALCLPNHPDFVIFFFAILKAGGVVVAINPNFTYPEIFAQVGDSGASFLIGIKENLNTLEKIGQSLSLKAVIFTGETGTTENKFILEKGYWLKELLKKSDGIKAVFPVLNGDDPAIFQYSGGTTGVSKAAIGLHRNLLANTLQFRSWLIGLEDGKEQVLLAIPLYHVYGMVLGMCVGVLLGARLVLQVDARDTLKTIHLIQSQKISFFPAVPTLLNGLIHNPEVVAGRIDLSSLRACISGSAPLSPEIRHRLEALTGANVMEGYGLSEAPTATHCNPMFGEKRSGSIGLPLPDVDCRIVDLDDWQKDVSVGEAGELLIRGPQVMFGYYNQKEETSLVLAGGWLHTGDIARMDSDGYFTIVDRKKDLIKVSGLQVWPREVEEVLLSHPGVAEAAVAGVPDVTSGERCKAWIVLKPGHEKNPKDLSSWCGLYLAAYKIPKEFEFVPSLPRTAVGKILRRELVRIHGLKK